MHRTVMLLVTQATTLGLFAGAAQAKQFRLPEATIADIHAAMKSGNLTCRALVQQYLNRIEAYDKKGPALNSIIMMNPKALAMADELDTKFAKSGFTGPLHCIPVILKDNFDTSDMPTTGGSLTLLDSIPPNDALITRKLKAAGAIVLAKANLHEFAVWGETVSSLGGQTRNPYDLTRTPGGSSGGTGAAIAIAYEQGFPLKVEPEHLLLAIVDTEQALALKVLKNLGVSIPQLREATLTKIQTLH